MAGATASVNKAMAGATKAMAMANTQMDPKKMQETMMQFQKQSEMMDMADEYVWIAYIYRYPWLGWRT